MLSHIFKFSPSGGVFLTAGFVALLLPLTPVRADIVPTAPVVAMSEGQDADPTQEINRLHEELTKAYEKVNAMNPLSQDFGKVNGSRVAATPPGTQASATAQSLRHGLHVAYQYLDRIIASPAFAQGVDGVVKSPSRMNLFYAELGLMLLIFALRVWLFKKSETWYGRLWANLWTGGLYWICSIVVLPWILIGPSYYQAVMGLLSVVTSHA